MVNLKENLTRIEYLKICECFIEGVINYIEVQVNEEPIVGHLKNINGTIYLEKDKEEN